MLGGLGRTMLLQYLKEQRQDLEAFAEYAVAIEGLPDTLAKARRLVWLALSFVAEHGSPTSETVAAYLEEHKE